MRTRAYKIGDNTYLFVNDTWERGRSWGHKTTLLKNGEQVKSNKITYINRTWESYAYQSCMKGCVYNLIDELVKENIDTYKRVNGVKRLSSNLKAEIVERFELDNQELYELLKKL